MQLTNAQLQTLRTRPHEANLYLSIYQPKTLMSAQVTGTYSTGDRQISYYAVTTGTYLGLYSDVTCLIGSTPGDSDVGRLRVRAVTGTYVDFAENAINWQTNQYLTFIDQIDIQAIYPRIIQDPNNQTNVIFYKDYDIPYSNQNSVYGTFPNAGPHRAGFAGSSFYFTATGTTNVLSESLTYNWAFEGGIPTGSTALTPGNVAWNSPGHYRTRLRVTSSSGVVDETHRYVSVYNRPNEGTQTPIKRWELRELSGSRSEGGYTASFKVYENIGNIQPNAVVVMFSDNTYGTTRSNLGGNAQNSSSIFFVGYIIGNSIKFDYQSSSVEFTVGSVSEIMKNAEGFSVSCESKASPTTWFELYEMNVSRAVYHYLRWHSTVLKVTDFQYTGENRLVQYFDSDRGSLYDAIDSFIRDGMLGEVVSDRQGKLWAEVSPFGVENPFSEIPHYLTIHKQDWMGEPSIAERRNSDLSFIEFGGIVYYGVATNTFSAILSNAPSTVPLYHGKSDRKEGLILNSQQHLNQLSGNYLAHHNTQFHEVSMQMNGTYTNLDIAPQERLKLVISPEDTVRNVSLLDKSYLIGSMEWKYSPTQQSLYPSVTMNQIATGTAGQTVLIPATPPYTDSGFDIPALDIPSIPVFDPSYPISNSPQKLVMHDTNIGLVYAENFDSSNPTWRTINAGLSAAQYTTINTIVIAPNGSIYVGRRGFNTVGGTGLPFIAYAPYIGGTFTIIEDEASLRLKFPGSDVVFFSGIGCNGSNGQVAFVIGGDSGGGKIYIGTGATFAAGATISNHSVGSASGVGSLTFGETFWFKTGAYAGSGNGAWWKLNSSASSVIASGDDVGDVYAMNHIRAGATGKCFHVRRFDKYLVTSQGSKSPFTIIGDGKLQMDIANADNKIACDPSGFYLMAVWDTGDRGRSSDGGYTWTGIPNLPVGGAYAFAYVGGLNTSSQWVAARGVVRYSPDFGGTWMNKEGNLTQLTATPSIDIVKAVGA